jgi:protocatechuate 3,4-dioxygenase beta subunit
MQKKNNPSRRTFIQKAALAPLALGLPAIGKSAESSSPVDDCFETTMDLYGQGPFYTPNAPTLENNLLAPENEPGTRLILSGIVRTLDCTELIPGTLIDIWHADHEGAYDNEGFHLRGKTTSNAQGFYLFETILPGKYLNGASYRPSHIHFKITPPGFPTLTTQLYFEGDTDIPGDAAASVTSGQFDATHRIIALTENGEGVMEGTWDIIVDGDGISGVNDLHLDKGIIYSATPNPFSTHMDIFYGVFQRAQVRIDAYDQHGVKVARLVDREMSPQKYTASWNDVQFLPAGHYWITIRINELQVHYLKVVKV